MAFLKERTILLGMAGVFVASLGFAYGALMMKAHIFPYRLARSLQVTALDLHKNWEMYLKLRPRNHLWPTTRKGQGVVVNKGSAVQPGLTLLSGLFDDRGSSVRLIDLDGNVVMEWPTRYSSIWPDPKHLDKVPFNDWFTDIHGLVLLPDHSIVFNFEYMGLSRVDRCGNVLWKVPRATHHAVFLAEDDTIWVPARKTHHSRSREFPNIVPPFKEETLLQVSLDGRILREISVLGLFYKNKMEGLLPTGRRDTAITTTDVLHLNDVDVLSTELAEAFESFDAGVLMISMRTPNLVLVFDPDTEEILWHQTGPWLRQHDPDFRADGLISIYDNRGVKGDDVNFGGSRLVLLDPMTRLTRDAYPHGEENWFFTPTRGRHQNLANGNVLIVEAAGGRVLEIAEDGAVVWSYLNRYDEDHVGLIQEASRYPADYLDATPKACGEP